MAEFFKRNVPRAINYFKMAYRRELYHLHGKLHDNLTIQTKQGLLTISTRDEGIGEPLFLTGQYEYDSSIQAIRFLKKAGFIPNQDVTMLDVGANIGIISIGLILSGEVHSALAIEPEPCNFDLLCKNTEQNGLSERICCLQMAAGEKESILDMELSENNPGDHRIHRTPIIGENGNFRESLRQIIQVKSLPLPQILALPEITNLPISTPSLVWIDVQGYEGYVFSGGKSLLARGLPTMSEVWPYGILRAGMTIEDYIEIVSSIWTDYWIEKRGNYIRYPITVFDRYLEELGSGWDEHSNIIFTKRSSQGLS